MASYSGEKTMRARQTLLLAAAMSATAPALAAWSAFGEGDAKAVWYVDAASIRTAGSVRQVWALKDMEQPVIDFDLSARFVYEVDCQGRRERLLQYQYFRGRMGGGEPTRGGMTFGDWAAVAPGTVGAGIVKAACAANPGTRPGAQRSTGA
jgi:hypothetical protein